MSSSNKLEMFFWILSFEVGNNSPEVDLEVCHELLLKLQLKPHLPIPDSYYFFLSPSENFRLPEVLPDVPPVVPLDVHLLSDYTWVRPNPS